MINHINPKAIFVREILEQNDLFITEDQWQCLETWVDRLIEINSRINLISRKHTEVVWLHQILHSITPLVLIDFPKDIELCDFGTGGGLPGVPLAILRPDWQVCLEQTEMIESIRLVRAIDTSIATVEKTLAPGENIDRSKMRRSIVTTRKLNAGEVISSKDIAFKRPGTGISAKEFDRVIGQIVKNDIQEDQLILFEDIK